MDKTHLALLVGNNIDYYFNKWGAATETGRRNTWNLAAFLFSILWLAYRKMYVYASIFSFFLLLSLFIQLVLDMNFTYDLILDLLFPAILGFFGNRIYHYFIKVRLLQFYAAGLPENKMLSAMREAGGTDFASVIGFFILNSVLIYLLYAWFNLVPAAFAPLNLLHALVT